ncbi:hypothetical protein SAMN05421736_10149 [Evansella caseinilytica]|uniref:Uncharacterized protein n=1 Tax=Evansella caseinilytica TaxID=1503961 RepID=A0A1H3G502_9BACI|nr:hypothetical protein [Evansella caseinilytica]SDX97439.1 hypothetical protein SAMN05421736_10149 [Evansella caseinilytica]
MKKLSHKQYQKAVDFIMTKARPIDRALFEYHFQNGSGEAVLDTLSKFQNKDGGVGNAMEPDVRCPQSSPIATTVAMQYAREVQAPWRHPFIQAAMNYFINVYRTHQKWPLILPDMNETPHAEWWHFTEEKQQFEMNPGAEVVGYFHAYPQSIPGDLMPEFHYDVTNHVFQQLENQTTPIEFHEALCCLRLAAEIPDPGKKMVIDYLRDVARDIATLDPKQWDGYCAKPLWLAPSPNSALFNVLEDAVHKNLEYEIAHQQPDGSWHPFWEWGQYQHVWKNEALTEWKGYLTVKTLKTLKNYERIDWS